MDCIARLQRDKTAASSPTPPEGHAGAGAWGCHTEWQNNSGPFGYRAPCRDWAANHRAAWSGEKSGRRRTPHHPNCCHTPDTSLPHQQHRDVGRTDLTFTMSAGVPTNPPVKPATKEELGSGGSSSPREPWAAGPSSSLTSHCAQQHFLVEGGRPLAALAQAVPCSLIDGKASQGICHLEERENEPLCPTGRPPPLPCGSGQPVSSSPAASAAGALCCLGGPEAVRAQGHSPAGTARR